MADTSVTAQTVIDNSIARAKDPSKTQWSDAQLLIFLNKASDYVHKLLIRINSEIVVEDATITMVGDTQEYDLAANLPDFWAMAENGVYIPTLGIPLTPVKYEDKVRSIGATTDDEPTAYYLTDTDIGIMDIPTTASTYTTDAPDLVCRYYKKNTTLALVTAMPYKNMFNEPMGAFMDNMALMKTNEGTAEFTATYNALEESVLDIANKRIPV